MPLFTARCIAPPITAAHLATWPGLFTELPAPFQGPLRTLLDVVRAHKHGWPPVLPSLNVRGSWGVLFEDLKEPCRTPAYHLLWAVNEIALGRSPTYD